MSMCGDGMAEALQTMIDRGMSTMIDRGITDWKQLNGKWKIVRRSRPQGRRLQGRKLAKSVRDYELEVSEGAVGQNKGEFCEVLGCDGKICRVCKQRKV